MLKSPIEKGLFLIFALWLMLASAMEAETSPADSITAVKIRDRVYFLTAEALEGRYPGSQGFRIAAEYAASQFRAAGLLTIIGLEGQRSYFQPVPLAKRAVTGPAFFYTMKRDAQVLRPLPAQGNHPPFFHRAAHLFVRPADEPGLSPF